MKSLLPNTFRFALCALSLAALAVAFAPAARGADDEKKDAKDAKDSKDSKDAKPAAAGSVTGTWKWSFTPPNAAQAIESTAKLTQDGEKLIGTITGRQGRETKIDEGTVKDGQITFKVSREANGQTFVSTYKGKVDGDKIKGTIESDRGGQTRSREWEATRVKDEKTGEAKEK